MPLGSCHASRPACFSVWLNFYSLPMKFLCREGKCSHRHRSEFISYHLVYGIFKDSALLAIITLGNRKAHLVRHQVTSLGRRHNPWVVSLKSVKHREHHKRFIPYTRQREKTVFGVYCILKCWPAHTVGVKLKRRRLKQNSQNLLLDTKLQV